MTYNGEVFDHRTLRARFPTASFQGFTDTETLLHGLAAEGLELLRNINGFFALAAIEGGRRLWLARDRLGVKPLYWSYDSRSLLFASEMTALLAAGVSREPDQDVLRQIATWTWAHGSRTPFRSIRRLLPGHILEVDLETLAIRELPLLRTADLVDPARAETLALMTRRNAADLMRATIKTAVRRRLEAEVPVGCLCSGGVDSGLVTTLAARERPGISAYVAAIPGQQNRDESEYARRICMHAGASLRTVSITADRWRAAFVAAARHFEYPLWHESSVALVLLAKRASDDGVKVLLGGEGADELLGGYDYKHPVERCNFALEVGLDPVRPTSDENIWVEDQMLIESFGPAPLPDDDSYRKEIREELRRAYSHHPGARGDLEAVLAAELNLFLSPALCRVDKNLMQHSVEYREPFLDLDMLSLGLNLPLEFRIAPCVKDLLREAAAPLLLPETLERPKLGFSFDPAGFFDDSIRPGFLGESPLPNLLGVDATRWRQRVETARGRGIFRLIAWEVWRRLFVENESEGEVQAALWSN